MLNKTQDVHGYQGGVRATQLVLLLSKFGESAWAVGGELARGSGDLMPVFGFITGLLDICYLQVAFPACAAASSAIYVPSLLRRKLLEVWIVTDNAYTVHLCLAVRSCQKSWRLFNCQNLSLFPGRIFCCSRSCFRASACVLPFSAITSSAALIFYIHKSPP